MERLTDWLIRPATLFDAAAIAIVHVTTWQSAYRGILPDAYLASLDISQRAEAWRQMLTEGAGTLECEVAIVDGAIVGFAAGGPARDEIPGIGNEVYAIYVRPDHERRGVGKALWETLTGQFFARDPRGVVVWALASNPCRRFYEKQGGELLALSKTLHFHGQPFSEVAFRFDAPKQLPEGKKRA